MGSSLPIFLATSDRDRSRAAQREAEEVRDLSEEFVEGQFETPGPENHHSIDRPSNPRGSVDDEWGRSDSVDPDNVGDIAGEGAGHRG